MKTFVLHACAFLALSLPTTAEVIGLELFEYPDGPLAGRAGGSLWDYQNFTPTGHIGTASTWDNVANAPIVAAKRLVTHNSSAKREYNGTSEGDGAVSKLHVEKSVYYHVVFSTGTTVPDSFGLSSLDFGEERLFFGKRAGQPKFGINEIGVGSTDSTTFPDIAPSTVHRLVVRINFATESIALWVDPDLLADESAQVPVVERAYTGTHWSTAVRLASSGGDPVKWNGLLVTTTWEDFRKITFVSTVADEDNGSLDPTAGGGQGISLREAVKYSTGSLITFQPVLSGQTIWLTHGDGDMEIPGDLIIDASGLPGEITLDGNEASRHFHLGGGKSLDLRGLTLSGGIVTNALGEGFGGAIFNDGGMLRLTRCTLSENSSDSGGAIYSTGGSVTLTQCTVSGNSSDFSGAIISASGPMTLTQCTLSGNYGYYGGAIFTDGPTTLMECTLSGNTGVIGGAIYHNSSVLTMTQCTVSGNAAMNEGGGIFLTTTSELLNCIVAGNSALASPDLQGNPPQTSGVNLIGVIQGSGLSEGPTVLVGSPKLSPLGWFGGPTQTMHPLPGSPAVLSGSDTRTDQRGFTLTGLPTIGAVKLGQVVTVTNETELRNEMASSANTTGKVIRLDSSLSGQTLTLSGGQLSVPGGTNGLFIDGSSLPFGLTIDANGAVTNQRVLEIQPDARVALLGVTLIGGKCTASTPDGGAIYNNRGTMSLMQCNLSGHSASDNGGAIYNKGGNMSLAQCTLSDNSATLGGAIYHDSTMSLTRCSLSGNSASIRGGEIYNVGLLALTQCTLLARHFDVIYPGILNDYDSILRLKNSIVAGQGHDGIFADIVNYGTVNCKGQNIVQTLDNNAIILGPIIAADPKLALLASNGGPTQTMALLPGSPALGAATGGTAATDQRGFRIVGTADLGAYESQGSTVTLTSADNPAIFGQSLTFTATVNELDPQTITPTGTVTFRADGNALGSPVALNASGIATLTTSTLAAGTHTITATYNGDARLLPSTSNTVNQTVIDLTVGNGNDSGNGSLRQALINAATHPGPDTITLPLGLNGQTLTLTSQLLINDEAGVTIDASGLSNGFRITNPNNAIHPLIILAANSTLTVKGVRFDDGDNVAIYNNGTLTLSQCSFSRRRNGAITNNGGTLTMSQCTVVSNSKHLSGGAIHNNGGTLMLTQCTLCYNSSNFVGGAIFNEDGTLTLTHCTLTDNSGSWGGAIYNYGGILTLTNSIANWNSPMDIYNGGSNASFTRIGANLVARYSNANGVTYSGPLPITADPELAPLGSYGGPTSTKPPLPGSPAIDQASALTPALTTDQRGQPRHIGARPDIGAVEVNIIEVTTHVDELDPTGAFGNGVSLREAIRDVESGGTIAFDRAVFNSLTTNTITLTKGPLNPQRNATLNASNIPGGIKIVQTPSITSQPLPLRLGTGANDNFTIAVANLSGGVTYQWRKDGNGLAGQTSPALVLNNVQGSDEALYDVRLTETATPGILALTNVVLGVFEATSLPASLIVDGAPLTVQRGPASAMLALGASHTLSVFAIGPAFSELTYQWFKGSAKVSGATKSSLTFARAALTDAGAYTCVVKSGLTSVTSPAAEIGVVDTMPRTVNLKEGARFTATVSAAGNGLQPFYWKRGSTPLTPTASKFTIESVGVIDAGLYTCAVTGLAGTITAGCNTLLNVSGGPPSTGVGTLPPSTIGQTYYYKLPNEYNPGAPVTSFSMRGTLPTGITFNTTTGVLSGRPTVTKPGGYPLIFRTINASGPSIDFPATLTVNVLSTTAVGVFAGPLERSPLNDNLGGRFDLTTTASGLCSGSLTLGGRTAIRFTNQLLLSAGSGDVILRTNIPGILMADKTPLTAYVEIFATDQTARLTLVHPNGTTLLATAWRNSWSKTRPATAYAATYTARLDPANSGTAPRGYGFATLTVAADGSVKTAGKLPDGSGLTQAGFVGPEGQLTLFSLLYANRGSLVGPMQINAGSPVANNTLGATLSWFKPAPLPKSNDTVYQAGFGPLNVTVEGSPYAAPAKGQRVMGLGTAPNPNAKLDFILGGLAPEFAQLLYISNPSATGLTNKGTLTLPLTNSTKLTTLDAAKGSFTGSFQINGATTAQNRPAPFEGLIVKIGATTQGYGYFLLPTATAKISTSPKLSGRLVLGLP